MNIKHSITRRDFLKLTGLGVGSLALLPSQRQFAQDNFPKADRLGRVNVGKAELKARPDVDSETVGALYQDTVVPWIREVVGSNPFRFVQRFVETPEGYIWSPHFQLVRNHPNPNALTTLPVFGKGGMWVEVTVPYVNLILANPPVRSPAFRNGVPQRLYYQQVNWVDEIELDSNGQVWYRVNERFGSYGDIFWAPAESFRTISPEEIAPINPEFEDKKIVVNINENVQTLSCYEGKREVYFCRISAGRKADITGKPLEKSATPLGPHPTYWKLVSVHMSGGASGVGWDLTGVAWPTFFAAPGIAIHATFWHNNFGGEYMSHGCVNAEAEDAKWISRWSRPHLDYNLGEVTVQMPGGTRVEVIEV